VVLTAVGGACVKKGYPLGKDGSVDIRIDVQEKLFAADVLDAQGKPVGPRQQPFATGVLLYMSDNGESAYGAYVDVRVDPPEALAIAPASESDDSCELVDGSFRCTATTEGFARFELTSENDWSGDARIIVSWSGSNGSNNEKTITILPAGLPPNATNFGLVVNGITGDPVTDRIRPTFETLKCTVGPAEDDPLPKWREGAIRGRPAFVRATAPASSPGVVEHAPVIVESLNSEGELSLVPDCSERESRLRVLLGATGQSDAFYLCFSDNGGTIPYSFSSGQLSLNKVDNGQPLDSLDITVDPEPRLVRVVTKNPVVTVGDEVDFELTAYNSDLVKIAMTLFAQPGDPTILQLTSDATLTTTPGSVTQGGEQNTNLEATVRTLATKEGSTELQVTPNLLSSPLCKSNKVTVQPLPPL